MFPVSVGVLEILVAGVTASTWFGLLVAVLAGWSHPPKWLGGGPTVLLVYATLAYGLGVVVDAAADTVFTWFLKWAMWPKSPSMIARAAKFVLAPRAHDGDTQEPLSGTAFQRLREAALLRDDGLAKFMEYQRSKQRIARAVTLNLLLLLPIGIWFFISSLHVSAGLIAGFAVVVLIGIVVSGRAAERLRVNYEGHLRRLPTLESASPLAKIRAAAVCVKAASSGEERLLVVRTKESASSPERWTFPKGHVEAGESLLDAAMREALEEAGAKGIPHSDPLPPYLFPTGDSGDALVVIPFLMEKAEQVEPTEGGRNWCWRSPEDAKELLRLNREDPFTNEHDEVINRAITIFRRR
jgi:8-oxo-dGTP pyrophosphatase MutT (NUDIX family)